MKNFFAALFVLFTGTAFSQTSITCDSILQTSTCAGGNVIIPFSTTGTFPWGNVFTAELSDNWGNFGSPVSMGTTMIVIGGNGIIFGTIPANTNFGIFYRVRIISSNPADTSSDSPNTLVVTQVAQLNQVVSNPGDSACPGDTITLFALNPAASYLWSTGDTTASIQVTQSGPYSVTTTDFLTCESTAYDTIVFDPSQCVGIAEQEMDAALDVYPNPASHSLNVYFHLPYGDDAFFEIRDVSGKIIRTEKLRQEGNGQQVDLTGISAGVYLFIFHSDEHSVTKKLIIE
jgi:hypothetical protein